MRLLCSFAIEKWGGYQRTHHRSPAFDLGNKLLHFVSSLGQEIKDLMQMNIPWKGLNTVTWWHHLLTIVELWLMLLSRMDWQALRSTLFVVERPYLLRKLVLLPMHLRRNSCLLAIRLALSKAKDAGFVGLSVFSDCQVAVKALTSGDAPPDRNSLPTFFSCV